MEEAEVGAALGWRWSATADEAVELVRRTGLAVFPYKLEPRGEGLGWDKVPLCRWTEESSEDPDEVRRLWARVDGQEAGVGVDCGRSGVFVVDEDEPAKLVGEWRAVLDSASTMVRRSVTRGYRHWYFRQPLGERKVLNAVLPFGDVRGASPGFVAVRPDASGGVVDDLPIVQAPPRLLLMLEQVRGRPGEGGGSGGGRYRTGRAVDEWVRSFDLEREREQGAEAWQDPSGSLLEQPVRRFWRRVEEGEPRREAARQLVADVFCESVAGFYPLSQAVERVGDEYRAARQERRGRSGASWDWRRELDLARLWGGMAEKWEGGDGWVRDAVEEKRRRLADEWRGVGEELSEAAQAWVRRQVEQAREGEEGVPEERRSSLEERVSRMLRAPEAEDAVEAPERPKVAPSGEAGAGTGEAVTKPRPEPMARPTGGGSGAGPVAALGDEGDAFFGPHGELARAVVGRVEADPSAVLAQAMAVFGAWIGRARWTPMGAARLTPALCVAIVGPTAMARKGTSLRVVRKAWEGVLDDDPPPLGASAPEGGLSTPVAALMARPLTLVSGIASGEALIDELEDAGPTARVVWVEEELMALLSRMGRSGSTLSGVVRAAFDGGLVRTRTRTGGVRAVKPEAYALSVIAHTTADELLTQLRSADVYGGTVNRFMWVGVPALPDDRRVYDFGLDVDAKAYASYRAQVGLHAGSASRVAGARGLPLSEAADREWPRVRAFVEEDSVSRLGLYASATARATTYVLKLALNYQLSVDLEASEVSVDALRAAASLWALCDRTAWQLFGMKSADSQVDLLVDRLREAHADPLQPPFFTARELNDLLRNYPETVKRASELHLIEKETKRLTNEDGTPRPGRPASVVRLADVVVRQTGLPDRSGESW